MHHGFIIVVRSPYGIAGFKLSSSDTVQVAQSPVSWTHTGCDQPNTKAVQTTKCIFGYSVVVCSYHVLTPPPHQQITPTERQGASDEAHAALGYGGRLRAYMLCTSLHGAPALVCVLVRWCVCPDGNWHKKRGGAFPILRAWAITSQFEFFLHLWMSLHGPKKRLLCSQAPLQKLKSRNTRHASEELHEPELPLTSSKLAGVPAPVNSLTPDEVIAKLLLVNIKWIAKRSNVMYMVLACDCCKINT